MRAMTAEPRFLDLPRGRFAYLSEGDPRDPLVLVLHGFPDTPHGFAPVLARVARTGRHAVAPFLRGYAPSTGEGPFDADTIADDVLAIAQALAPDAPFSIVGHDWGAVVTYAVLGKSDRARAAVALSVPHPVAFLEDLARVPAQLRRSWYMGLFQLRGVAERVVARDHFALIDRLTRDWSPGLRIDRPSLDRIKAAIAPGFPAALEYYRALAWPPADALRRVREARARTITTPTLHLTGACDGCIGPEVGRSQQRFFTGPFSSVVIEGAGHFLQMEQPELVAAHVLDWLAEHDPAAPRAAQREAC